VTEPERPAEGPGLFAPRPPEPAAAGRRRMPEEARAMGQPWEPLAGKVPGLSAELERDFRFGQTVFAFASSFRVGGSLKGGSSTMWRPASEQDLQAYQAWKAREGVPDDVEDVPAFEELAELLAANQVELWNLGHKNASRRPAEYVPGRGWVYGMLIRILRALPEAHLARPEFAALQLGGWGPASAKASAYENGRVFVYDFALGGAQRTLVGLFIHELGHAHETALTPAQLRLLAELHGPIAEGGALFGLEFLLDAESRKVYQQFLVSEFIAESYVAYTAAGPSLREFIARQAGRAAEAWRRVYGIYRETFAGIEYE